MKPLATLRAFFIAVFFALVTSLFISPSASATPLVCENAFSILSQPRTSSPLLDLSRYRRFRAYFEANGVQLGDPFRTSNEELIAAVDVLNTTSDRELGASERSSVARQLEVGDAEFYDQLQAWLTRWREHSRMRPNQIDRAVADLNRLLAEETLFRRLKAWSRKWTPRALIARFKKVPDDQLMTTLRTNLLQFKLKAGLRDSGGLETNTSRAVIETTFAQNKLNLNRLQYALFDAMTLYHGSLLLFLPRSGRTDRLLASPDLLEKIMKGEMNFADVRALANPASERAYNFIVSVLSVMATVNSFAAVPTELVGLRDRMAQARQQQFNLMIEQASKPVDARAQGESFFQNFVKTLRAKGQDPDLDSPEMRRIHQAFTAGFAQVKSISN